ARCASSSPSRASGWRPSWAYRPRAERSGPPVVAPGQVGSRATCPTVRLRLALNDLGLEGSWNEITYPLHHFPGLMTRGDAYRRGQVISLRLLSRGDHDAGQLVAGRRATRLHLSTRLVARRFSPDPRAIRVADHCPVVLQPGGHQLYICKSATVSV